MVKLILLVVALLFASPLWAVTYYVDFVGGADSNDGLTTGTAFQHCPGDDNATGVALSTNSSYVAGAIFIFKGGVTYVGEVDIDKTGTAGNPITYDGNSAGTWGAGPSIFDLSNTYYHAFDSTRNTRNYITIRGFNITRAKNINAAQNQTITRGGMDITGVNYGGGASIDLGVIHNFSGSNWDIRDCKLYKMENWDDRSVLGSETDADPQTSSSVPTDQVGISLLGGSSNCTVTNVEFWGIGRDCMRIMGSSTAGASSGHIVQNCNFGGGSDAGADAGWFSVAIRIVGAHNLTVRDNVFHDGWQYQGNEDVAGVPTQRSHAGDWLHIMGDNDAIFEENTDSVNVTVERNYFYNSTSFIGGGGTATVFVEDGVSNLTIRNNLFINDFSGAVEIEAVIGCYIYSNTFVSLNPTMSSVHVPLYFFTGSGALLGVGPTGVVVKNNVFVALNTNSVGMCWGTSASGITYPESNYNRFYAPNLGSTNIIRWHSINRTLAQWQADSGQDANSTVGDPLLVGTLTALPTSSSATNYRAASIASPIVGTGTVVSGFSTDYASVERGSTWDIGAYEFQAPLATGPASRLRLRIQ